MVLFILGFLFSCDVRGKLSKSSCFSALITEGVILILVERDVRFICIFNKCLLNVYFELDIKENKIGIIVIEFLKKSRKERGVRKVGYCRGWSG